MKALSEASPLAEAGVRPGDVILGLAGQSVNAPEELSFRLSLQELDSMVEMRLLSDGRTKTVAVEMRAAATVSETLGDGPVTLTNPGPFQGLVVQEVTPALADRLGLRGVTDGVIILGINDARRARHFQPGDVVTEVNGAKVSSMADFTEAVKAEQRTWKVVLNRRGGRVYLTWRG